MGSIDKVERNLVFISFITLSELYYGAYKSVRQQENLNAVAFLASNIQVIGSTTEIAEVFGKIKAGLIKRGRIIDDADIFIAAAAITNELSLVTNNIKHFENIPGIRLENWKKN